MTTPPLWLDRGRIPSLDGVRGIAILLVLLSHLHFPYDHLAAVTALKGRAGFLGVQLFFVLSGFLITTLMIREIQQTGRFQLVGFYLRRCLRILPAYLAFLAVLAGLQIAGVWRIDGVNWFALLTYTVNSLPRAAWQISHVWSLSVEEHFYLLWPLVVFALPLARSRWVAFAVIPVVLVVRTWIRVVWPEATVDLWTITRLDDLAVGCLLAFAVREEPARAIMQRCLLPGKLAFILGGFVLAQVVCSRAVGSWVFGPLLPLALACSNLINSVVLALLLWGVISRSDAPGIALLRAPVLEYLGLISYSLYLWHPLWSKAGLGVVLELVAVFLTAMLSYHLIECPFLALKPAPRVPPQPAPKLPATPVSLPSSREEANAEPPLVHSAG